MIRKEKIYILCGVHNDWFHTQRMLNNLLKQNYENFEIVIIDDGSTDNTYKKIQQKYKEVKLIKGDGSLWWTGSLNRGLEYILKKAKRYDFVLTLNNDSTFGKNYISILKKASIDSNRAIAGSLIIDIHDKNKILDSGVKVDWRKARFVPHKNKLPLDKEAFRDDIDVLSTKGTIFPIEVFQDIGSFDDKGLPHYLSDYEFSYRAKSKGYKLILSFNAKVYSDDKKTGIGKNIPNSISINEYFQLLFSRRSRINIFDHLYFVTKHCPLKYKLLNYFVLIAKSVFLISRVRLFKHNDRSR